MGMKCPKCRSYESRVLNTHYDAGRPKRYRRCTKCNERWVTIEEILQKPAIMPPKPTPAPAKPVALPLHPQELYG